MAMVRDGWQRLQEQDEGLGAIAATVVDTVFVTGADWLGSMSEAAHVGTLWIMPGRNWQPEEVVEAYLHELTHTLLFLDERRYGHFLPAASEVRVRSAIRQDVREYPAVVHSALVAAELLDWRDRRRTPDSSCSRLHGPTPELTARAQHAHSQVMNEDQHKNLLTPRMRELIEQAGERIYAGSAR
ncbi:aKG-HExxH-type peptide beta-hydroxylase [Streptomyces sp. NPDC020965]|uniref:aKG-HExxH-type peptide beta-hydroxylase n=1 Tax=Streptomyces sp. NPDC020965 TaxID=3365105 RepID=UPI00378DCAD9